MDIIDLHAHILPECDHGSRSVEVTLKQLENAWAHGVRRIIATPHFYPHKEDVRSFAQRRDRCYAVLAEKKSAELPKIRLGAEVLICDNIDELPDLAELCIEGTRALLLELPFTDFSRSHIKSVKYLIHDGYDVILAHADRYKKDDIEQLLEVGAKIQLNVGSICRHFGNKHLFKWMKDGHVSAIGSDVHGCEGKEYKNFQHAVKKIGHELAELIMTESDKLWSPSRKS